jgi:hypothetical protein
MHDLGLLSVAVVAVLGCGPRATTDPAPARSTDAGPGRVAEPAERGFTLAADDPCASRTRVEDFGTWTLLISPTRARRVDPGRPLAEAPEMGADLPPGRGTSWVFATKPAILSVEVRPLARMEQGVPKRLFRLDGERWSEMRADFGDVSAVLPVESGLVVTGWVFDPIHGDTGGVPAGDLTRAWRVSLDGGVSPWGAWPYVMSWQERSTPRTVWAVVAKPRRPGQFMLRLPLDGPPRLYPIPGLGDCRGDDRLTNLATLASVTDDEARVSIFGGDDCVPASASGVYRLAASRGRWSREGPPLPETLAPDPGDVTAADRKFSIGVGEVLVRGPGPDVRHLRVPDMGPGSPVAPGGSLQSSARDQEVWALTQTNGRCRVYRY